MRTHMSNAEQKLPPVAMLIAVLLVINGIWGLWLLSGTLIGGTSMMRLPPSFADEHESVIAYVAAGLGFGCLLLAGLALFVRRKRAIFFYVMGAIFYTGFMTIAYLAFFAEVAWRSIVYDGSSSAGVWLVLTVILAGGGAIGFFIIRAVYNYLQELSGDGVLR